MKKPMIGFIGQGYIGKNYADDFERRGYAVVRYSLEEEHSKNASKIKDCDIVFIAVPTPTKPDGYDDSVIRQVIPLAGKNKTVVLKSTILPGLTRRMQKDYPDYIILHAPEFLSEATAVEDAAHPFANIVGMPDDSPAHREAARQVQTILPPAPFSTIVSSEEAEIIKYAHNGSGYTQVVFFNLIYELARALGADWANIAPALQADPLISNRYADPLHKGGRGAGGNCFIKDFAALRNIFREKANNPRGLAILEATEKKNIELLRETKKDLDLLRGVYGDSAM